MNTKEWYAIKQFATFPFGLYWAKQMVAEAQSNTSASDVRSYQQRDFPVRIFGCSSGKQVVKSILS